MQGFACQLSAMTHIRPMAMLSAAMIAAVPQIANADDWITPKLSAQPERVFEARRPFYEVERCVVYSSVRGWVYRTPDRPKETLWIDAGNGTSRHILWQLIDLNDGVVRLNVFEGVGNLNDDTKKCFDTRAGGAAP